MAGYIFRRILQSALVLLVVGLIAFAMFRFVGDPIDNMLGQESGPRRTSSGCVPISA